VIENYNNVDLGMPLGLGFEFSRFTFEVRYILGLSDINENDNIDRSLRNSVVQTSIGFRLHHKKDN